MRSRVLFPMRAMLVAVLPAMSVLWSGCNHSPQTAAPVVSVADAASGGEQVFIQFEGPWAFAPDPKDPNLVVAIAPKTTTHRELYVKASNQSTLKAGNYQLSVPSRTGPAAGTVDPNIAQAKIDAQALQRALNEASEHYVVRVPKPDAYIAAGRSRSRLGASYPPDASTEKEYATAVSLRYAVASRNGFSVAGAPKTGTFNPMLLQVDTPLVRFAIEPAQDDDPADTCDTHSRESFRNLTQFLGLKLYVDFPNSPADCRKKDPQVAPAAKADLGGHFGIMRMARMLAANVRPDPQEAGVVAAVEGWARSLAAAFFFARPMTDCKAPILVLTTS